VWINGPFNLGQEWPEDPNSDRRNLEDVLLLGEIVDSHVNVHACYEVFFEKKPLIEASKLAFVFL